jgi:beta-glucanase (GH16 family)/regulation of enolase protein 1 (concanavalin A-like superfamily)
MNTFRPFRNKKPSGLRTLASMLVLLMLLMAMPGPLTVSAQPLEQTGWVQQWADEFNDTGGVNTGNWIYDTGTSYPGGPANWGTGEIQSYSSSTSNVFQSGGSLNIRALHSGSDPVAGWTSGRIETQRADFQPPAGGQMAVEARVQLPNVSGAAAQGYWPAFWMLGVGYRGNYWNWPGIGEIDILENINGANQWWGTLHCGTSPGGPCNETTGLGGNTAGFSPSLQTAYHTYRMEYDRSVSPEQIRWYVDGIQRHIVYSNQVDATTWNNATNHGFFILFNVAMGGGWPGNPTGSTASGGTMLVDYVRVYYASSGITPTIGPSPTPTTPPVSEPYLGSPVSLPGTIQAENFDLGGEGVAFHETTGGNQGGYAYRTDQANSGNVDIANNCNVCVNYVAPSEWLRYAVSVATAGNYTFNIRHAGLGGGVFHVETTTGVNLTGPITQANTGSWDAYVTSSQAVSLPAGNYGIRLVFDSCAACNLNNVDWISFTGGPTITVTPSRTSTPTRTPTQPPGGGLPSPWQHQDVGAVGLAGNATYSSGSFTIDGGGADIWGAADEFHYVYQTLTGDGTITARVASLENTNAWAKAGVMIRESLASNSKHAMMVLTPSNGLSFQRRTATGGTSASTSGGAATAPRWVRMVRSGSTFTAYSSTNGVNWTTVGSASISMGSSVTVGLAVTAHNDATLATAVFDNVSVTGGGPTPTFTPTPTNTPFTGGEYTQGVTAIDSANARIWFHSNVNSAWVDVHYTINGGAQLNYRMTFNSATGNWEQNVPGLSPGGVLYYFFTYEKGGAATDTQWFQYIVPSGPTPTNTAIGPTATTPPSGTNLALNKPATASASCNTNETPNKAVNGSVSGGNSDKWCDNTSASKWLRVDLGASYNITQFIVRHAGAGGESVSFNTSAYNIQLSNDGSTWNTVVTVSGNTANVTTNNIAAASGRYARLNVTNGGSDGVARIYEFEVYGGGGGPTPTPGPVTCTGTGPTGTFPMCFQNNTGGAYADSQIYVTILGIPPASGTISKRTVRQPTSTMPTPPPPAI